MVKTIGYLSLSPPPPHKNNNLYVLTVVLNKKKPSWFKEKIVDNILE